MTHAQSIELNRLYNNIKAAIEHGGSSRDLGNALIEFVNTDLRGGEDFAFWVGKTILLKYEESDDALIFTPEELFKHLGLEEFYGT